ncbi:MAG TPA: MotA/TolQ/ExbB proton channel family protein [Bacteroidales bacterium]|nr:MotA/TolQ/ExbB proton channel family protein [Bacteroidales bacterium]HRZ48865.1 MotA/TolQ/ExbB proton channel family protein [Bacteroidales bacterium]
MLLFAVIQEVGAGMTAPVQDTVQEGTKKMLSMWELIQYGGWAFMGPLFLMLALAAFILVERFLTINRASKEEGHFMFNIRDLIHDGKIEAALALCRKNGTPISRMVEKGINRIGRPLNDINAAIENVGKLEVSRLEKNIATLATISGSAPMIGFLGTVVGMVKVFFRISNEGNQIRVDILSEGMYQAMVTTVAGLIVGILAYISYNFLVARIEKVVYIMEARATEFMDLLHEPAV